MRPVKAVSISAVAMPGVFTPIVELFAVDELGQVWRRDSGDKDGWYKLPPLPQVIPEEGNL